MKQQICPWGIKFIIVFFAAGSWEEQSSERSFSKDLRPKFKVHFVFLKWKKFCFEMELHQLALCY